MSPPEQRKLALILAPIGSGARNNGTQYGPHAIYTHEFWPQLKSRFASVDTILVRSPEKICAFRATRWIARFNKVLKQTLLKVLRRSALPVVIGGDHTIAMATWSAIAQNLGNQNLGLIWVDAHMDAHTRSTSVSQATHGMPVAVLLGEGDPELLTISKKIPVIKPEHFILMGPRSFEAGEAARLKRLGVRIYFDEEIKKRGFETCWNEALQQLEKSCPKIGLSIDLDAYDPNLIPGVGSPAKDGLIPKESQKAMFGFLHHPKCAGVEIAEFNPFQDHNDLTIDFIHALILGLNHEES